MRDYPFIRWYCTYVGSFRYYEYDELCRAREDKAPEDAYAWKSDGKGGRTWFRASDIPKDSPFYRFLALRGITDIDIARAKS
jgi:hypothetical protein